MRVYCVFPRKVCHTTVRCKQSFACLAEVLWLFLNYSFQGNSFFFWKAVVSRVIGLLSFLLAGDGSHRKVWKGKLSISHSVDNWCAR